MKQKIKAYADAFEAHANALKNEQASKVEVKRTRNILLMAREELKAEEWELLTS